MEHSATGTSRQNLGEVATISHRDDDVESDGSSGSVDSAQMTPYIIDQELSNLPAVLHKAIQNSAGTFGEVNINNSKDVHIGPKIYTAPVTLEVVNPRHGAQAEDDIIQEKHVLEYLSKAGHEFVGNHRHVQNHDLAHDKDMEREDDIKINHTPQKIESFLKRRLGIIAGAVLLLILSASLAVYLVTAWAHKLKDGMETDELFINASWFIPRKKWNARDPGSRELLHLPVKFAVMGHTVSSSQFSGTSDPERRQCYDHVGTLQYDHMVFRGWADLGYNYLVCGNGDVIVARGSNAIDIEEVAKGYSCSKVNLVEILSRTSGVQRAALGTFCTLLFILITLSIVFGAQLVDHKLYPPETATGTTDPATASPPYNCLVNRAAWSMLPSVELEDAELPVPLAVITHTGTPGCNTAAECTSAARSAQAYHVSRGWLDVGYNFLVGGDGYVYVGRGWGKVGCHTEGVNSKSVGIAFIGLYHNRFPNYDTPTPNQIRCTHNLIYEGVIRGYLSQNYSLVGSCDLSPGIQPGNVLLKEIHSWPHYGLANGEASKCSD